MSTVAIGALILALVFDFVNGFHDTSNAVATVIYSKALRPWVAITMSAVLNFLGALTVGTTVAMFVTGVIPLSAVSMMMIWSVLLAGLCWNVLTWWRGLPVSSSHCMLGSLVGAGLASGGLAGVNFAALYKALIALVVSPVLGFILCVGLAWLFARWFGQDNDHRSGRMRRFLPYAQILSSASVSFSHGSNDGQKTMGLILLILVTESTGYSLHVMPLWVIIAAAAAIGLGTAIGGGRVIKTVGEKLSHKDIDPAHGCAAELTTAATVFGASYLGVPVSTTHVLTSAVVGGTVGMHGHEQTNKDTLRQVAYAWLLTLPITALLAALLFALLSALV